MATTRALVKALAGYRMGRGTECPFCEADLRDDEKSAGDDGQGTHHKDCPVVEARALLVSPTSTTIPGITAKHAIITDECRENRGAVGAFEEAVRRLQLEYYAIVKLRHAEKGVNYHLALVVEDTKRAKRSLPERADEAFNTLADRQRLKAELLKKEKRAGADVKARIAKLLAALECAFPTEKDLAWLEHAMQRHTQGMAGWWADNKDLGFAAIAKVIIDVWEAGRVKTDKVHAALEVKTG